MATLSRLTIIVFLMVSTAPGLSAQLLEQRANLFVEDIGLSEALVQLQITSGIALPHSPSLLPGNLRVDCHCRDVSIRVALDRLLAGTGFTYVEIGERILIEPARRRDPSDPADPLPSPDDVEHALPRVHEERPAAPAGGRVIGRVIGVTSLAPLRNAHVTVLPYDSRVLTDPDGRYILENVPSGPATVRVQLIGYRAAEREVFVSEGRRETLDFSLVSSAIELDGFVVSVGAAGVRRREMGTDIASIDVSRTMETAAVQSFSDLLAGRAANVRITPASGILGAGSRIRIRGVNSLTQDNNPLIVIDGVRVTNSTDLGPVGTGGQTGSRFDDLNPGEIEDIQIIKGPSATALYGSEAAPGVIVITTRKGRQAENQFFMSIRSGMSQNPAAFPDTYMNLTPYYGVTSLADPRVSQFRLEQHPLTGDIFALDNPFMDTDSRPFRNGWFNRYNLSYQGGSEQVTFYTGLDLDRRGGAVAGSDLSRMNWRGNALLFPSQRVDLAVNSGFIASSRHFPDDNSVGTGLGVAGMLGSPLTSYGTDPQKGPGEGICLEDALLGLPNNTTGRCRRSNGKFGATFDKILGVDQGESLSRFTVSATGTWRVTERLTAAMTAGIDNTDRRVWDLIPFDPELPFGNASLGSITDHREANRIVTVDSRSTLSLPLGQRLHSTTSFGTQYFGHLTESITCTGSEFPSDNVSACNAAQQSRGFSSLYENVEIGAFLQERLGWNGYLFVTGALRMDDNSTLGSEAGLIWSPSFNGSAVLSEMPFWRLDPLDEMRLRFAWGKASQSPGRNQARRTYASSSVLIDNVLQIGITPSNPGNPLLGPERTEEVEVGFDAGALEGRLGIDFTWFQMRTEDLIVPTPVPPSSGFPGLAFTNLGAMETKGLEAQVSARVVDRPGFSWEARFQHSMNRALITDLGLSSPIIFPVGAEGGSRAAGTQIFQTGFAPGAYISPVIGSATRDASGNITSFTFKPGNLGDDSNRRVVGQPFPTNDQSLANTFTVRERTRLTILLDRAGGHQMLNVTQAFRTPFIDQPRSSSYSREYAMRQVVMSPEDQAMVEQRILAPFVEDADFIKLREITISYDLPPALVGRFGGIDATVIFGGRNLATWTGFSGLDPEMNVRGAREEFTANNFAGSFPPLRTFWGSVRIRF